MTATEAQARPKILCVDDEASILQSLERLFKTQFQVLTCTSAADGFTLLKEHSDCAVVLSDFRMPEMNGVEFLREVRQIYPLTSRAILSGQIDLQQVSDAINNHDIHKFFLKPWENEYLTVQMMEALQLHRTLREKAHYEHLSVTDPVTQVTNHRFFQDQLRREMHTNKESVALLIFDVDHFKAFNDRFGHPEGDRLLFSVAKQLETFAAGNGYVSRYGGEEFTMILPGFTKAGAVQLAERIRSHFERTPFAGLSSSAAYITLSAGLAMFPEHATHAGELIEAADRALYQAKRQGRNQITVAAKIS
ncbi:MAG: diguanylate cyclase [Bdellovibrionales bacterium]|nr:diguanylate cyclase [Bdellovibrionales bacterium]